MCSCLFLSRFRSGAGPGAVGKRLVVIFVDGGFEERESMLFFVDGNRDRLLPTPPAWGSSERRAAEAIGVGEVGQGWGGVGGEGREGRVIGVGSRDGWE